MNPGIYSAHLYKKLTAISAGILLFAAQILLNERVRNSDAPWVDVEDPMLNGRDNPAMFRILSVGQLPVAIDWVWLQALVDPSMGGTWAYGRHPRIYYQFELITELDPENFDAYSVGANLLSVVRNDGAGARDLLLKGEAFRKEELPKYARKFQEKYWGTSWSLPMLLGYVYMFELQDLPKAADAFLSASEIQGAPIHVRSLADRIRKPGGIYEVGYRLLNILISTTNDPRVLDELEQKKRDLQVVAYLGKMNEEFAKAREKDLSVFLMSRGMGDEDPWGGRLSVNPRGRITTTTPYRKVFGLTGD